MGRHWLPLAAGVLALLLLPLNFSRHVGVYSNIDGLEGATPPNPYDSIRTDLSDYMWPTEVQRATTSTFAEFRRTHFHGGIDIGTGSTTGYRVFAARDGYVARIRISAVGYGKMLYVRHPDGYYSTYAHLRNFVPEIDARVEREQKRLERYPVSIVCAPEEFPVKKGALIAYTGETGVGSPHLHFEIRDENLNPVNPLLCENLRVADDIPPSIYRISISPLDQSSLVNGAWTPQIFKARQLKVGRYHISETIRITGEAGFGISVRDRSNNSRFRHGVYGHDLYINDSLLYTVRLDRVPGEDSHQIGIYYDWSLLNQGRGRFERLYMDTPNRLPFYSPKVPPSGVVNTGSNEEGPHEFKIVTRDFNDNTSEISGKLILNHPPVFDIEQETTGLRLRFADPGRINKVFVYWKRNTSSTWNSRIVRPEQTDTAGALAIPLSDGKYDVVKLIAENSWGSRSAPRFHFLRKPHGPPASVRLEHEAEREFVRLHVRTSGEFTTEPSVVVYEGGSRRIVETSAIDINHYVGTFRPLETFSGTRRLVAQAEVNGMETSANAEFRIFPLIAGESGEISVDDGRFLLTYEPSSVFRTLFVRIEKRTRNDEVMYAILPDDVILNAGVEVSVRADAVRQNEGLFFLSGGKQSLLTKSPDSTGTYTASLTRTLGEVSLLTDDSPPYIAGLAITRTSTQHPVIKFRFGDSLSDVDYDEVKVYIDGTFVVPEIDGEHHRVVCTVTEPLERGPHQLTIRMRDYIGNSSEVERQFDTR